ncbi:hypothetical protein G9A89_009236 [Geosiphon pyriformis]|nr:hypothetical protein G9A89_009236 [Geosiphon pyriformis]
MASVEDIKRQLEVATTQYERCVEELKEFRKSEEGNRLSELKNKMRGKKWTDTEEKEAWTQEKEELEEELKELKTRGLERPPKDEQTTRVMTCSLLTGLKRLHQKDYVHRDICLSNIIYDSNNSQGYEYVLIDFEHGGKINEKFDILLINWDDGTLDKNNLYTTLSDMYQLGKLLEELNTVFSNDGQDFISKLKKKMLEADAALQHPWIASI